MKKLIILLLFLIPISIKAYGQNSKDSIYLWFSQWMYENNDTYSIVNDKIFTLATNNIDDIKNSNFGDIIKADAILLGRFSYKTDIFRNKIQNNNRYFRFKNGEKISLTDENNNKNYIYNGTKWIPENDSIKMLNEKIRLLEEENKRKLTLLNNLLKAMIETLSFKDFHTVSEIYHQLNRKIGAED